VLRDVNYHTQDPSVTYELKLETHSLQWMPSYTDTSCPGNHRTTAVSVPLTEHEVTFCIVAFCCVSMYRLYLMGRTSNVVHLMLLINQKAITIHWASSPLVNEKNSFLYPVAISSMSYAFDVLSRNLKPCHLHRQSYF
jgi:hypothetical protein